MRQIIIKAKMFCSMAYKQEDVPHRLPNGGSKGGRMKTQPITKEERKHIKRIEEILKEHKDCLWQLYKYDNFHIKTVSEIDPAQVEYVNRLRLQRLNGEFINNSRKYNIHTVASDGLPIIPIKEPQILKDYENGIL